MSTHRLHDDSIPLTPTLNNNMNQKRFSNIILVVVIVLLLGTVGCFVVNQQAPASISTPTSEETILKSSTVETETSESLTPTVTYLLDSSSTITGPPQPGSQELITEPLTGFFKLSPVEGFVPPNTFFLRQISEINFTSPSFTVQGDSGVIDISTIGSSFHAKMQINGINIDLRGRGSFSTDSVGLPNAFHLKFTGGQYVLQFSATVARDHGKGSRVKSK